MKAKRVIFFTIPILLTAISVLLLLTYVGYGEARRVYPKFQIRKLATQIEIIQYSLSSFLQAGLPLAQFSGFTGETDSLLLSDPGIENIQIRDANNNIIFFNSTDSVKEKELLGIIQKRTYAPTRISYDKDIKHKVEESLETLRVTLTVESKFGTAGYIVVESSKTAVFKTVNDIYKYVFMVFVGLSALFVTVVFCYETFSKGKKHTRNIIKYSYIFGFVIMSFTITVAIFNIYGNGARNNTKALSDSMSQRLSDVFDMGIDIKDISGIEDAFNQYKAVNHDINAIALIQNGINVVNTNANSIGKHYSSMPENYEYVVTLKNKSDYKVAVSVPYNVVLKAILGSAKNFIVLFIACGIISMLFLEVSIQLLTKVGTPPESEGTSTQSLFESGIGLVLVKPAYFMIVFVSALSVSFLPQLVAQIIPKESSLASVSLPFSIYYFIFAISMIPSGQYAEKGSLKFLMSMGFISEIVGLILVASTDNFWILSWGRIFSGIGQGTFLIGLQSYLLVIAPEDKKTEAAAIKVNGRNAALISGSAIGALLYSYMEYKWLFVISAVISLIGFVYLLLLVPKENSLLPTSPKLVESTHNSKSSLHNVLAVLKDAEFMKALIFVGFPGKISITGVIMFSIPLMMIRLGFPSEDIGQALMIYYISSMVMTYYASKMVDHSNKSQVVLFGSAIVGGAGMFLLGLIGTTASTGKSSIPGLDMLHLMSHNINTSINTAQIPYLIGSLIVFCLIIIGISNGLLSAPILTHITKTSVAQTNGQKSVSSTYTFLERVAHVMGPIIISQLFFLTNQSNVAISIFGLITIVMGFVFIVTSKVK